MSGNKLIKAYKSYAVIPKPVIQDRDLSLRDIGFYTFLCNLPDNWNFSERGLASILKDGYASVHSSVLSLEEHGYLKRIRLRGEKGKVANAVWILAAEPFHFDVEPDELERLESTAVPHPGRTSDRAVPSDDTAGDRQGLSGDGEEGAVIQEPPSSDFQNQAPSSGFPNQDFPDQDFPSQENRPQYNNIIINTKEYNTNEYIIISDSAFVVSMYNGFSDQFVHQAKATKKITQLVTELGYTEADYKDLFQHVLRSDFLTGKKGTFRASMSWILDHAGIIRKGVYDNASFLTKERKNGFEREYTPEFYHALEKQLNHPDALTKKETDLIRSLSQ